MKKIAIATAVVVASSIGFFNTASATGIPVVGGPGPCGFHLPEPKEQQEARKQFCERLRSELKQRNDASIMKNDAVSKTISKEK